MSDLHLYQKNLQYLKKQGRISDTIAEDSLVGLLSASQQSSLPEQQLLHIDLEQRWDIESKGIRMLIMDCDGVLTDGAMIFSKNGDEVKNFNAKDGQGIKNCIKAGMHTGIISAGISTGLVEKRAEMLGVEKVYVGKQPKLEILESWLAELELGLDQVAYIGDDVTDIPILEKVGASFCPANAVNAVKEVVKVVLSQKGGEGCVRELVESYLLAKS